jgi:hypothetical protein
MRNCKKVQRSLVAEEDSGNAEIADHISSCPACRAFVSDLDTMRRLVRAAPERIVPAELSERANALYQDELFRLGTRKAASGSLHSSMWLRLRRIDAAIPIMGVATLGTVVFFAALFLSWAKVPETAAGQVWLNFGFFILFQNLTTLLLSPLVWMRRLNSQSRLDNTSMKSR